MKKSSRIWSLSILMMICLCMVLSIPSIPVQAADNLSENEMIYGADIGFLSQLESQGVEWVDDNGNTIVLGTFLAFFVKQLWSNQTIRREKRNKDIFQF